jgi:hypothetical protein
MGRHKQPLELAILKGADRNHPERYRNDVPKSGYALGEPPEYMSEAAQAAWSELEACSLPGVLTGSDCFMVEISASLLAQYRGDPGAFLASKYSVLIGCLARLGLSPADRQKFGVSEPKPDNPFDKF